MFSIQPENYQSLLTEKSNRIRNLFLPDYSSELEIFPSQPVHYRMRAEFRLWREDNKMHYVMFEKGKKNSPVFISEFNQAHESIANLMFPLLEEINKRPLLAARLFQMDFLASQAGEGLVTLIYHRNLVDAWEEQARELAAQFNIKIIGRARKQKRVLTDDFITETLSINNVPYHYRQIENSFSQPNAKVCEKMIEWVLANIPVSQQDLLELYCGNGNFTIPLASKFRKVLATEVSKTSIKAAKENCFLNKVINIDLVRLSSSEISQAFANVREFRRLADTPLTEFNFNTLFVDPPRAGMDAESLNLARQFDTILYISCNPETLRQNIDSLENYDIQKMAIFDQFPYTEHVECGAVLKRKSK